MASGGGVGLLLMIGFALVRLLASAANRRTADSGTTTGTPLPKPSPRTLGHGTMPASAAPRFPKQRGPTTLEELRAEMLAALEQTQQLPQPVAAPTVPSLPAPARGKARVPTRVRPETGGIQPVDYDEQAEVVIRARRDAAERHNVSLDESSHRAFHQKIEAPPATARPVRIAISHQRVREAMIWREILDPPLALRPERDS